MADLTPLAALREALARLYGDERSARRVASDIGLDAARIAFQGTAQNIWFSVIEEADKQRRVDDLRALALREYPNDEALSGRRPEVAPVLARTLTLKQRQRLVGALARAVRDIDTVERLARQLDASAPDGADVGSAIAALVQELTLRNGNLAPLYALTPGGGR